MPAHYEKQSGKKPHKIVEKGGHVVGSSTSAAKAKSSVRARNAARHGWKPTGKPRRGK